jgi:hypothetical protein
MSNPGKIMYKEHLGKKPKVTCETDYRDIRIYINDILHLIIPRPIASDVTKDSIRLQSYLVGSRKTKFYYIEVSSNGEHDYYGYDNFEIWRDILKLLDDNI